jgi:hypothetical protein
MVFVKLVLFERNRTRITRIARIFADLQYEITNFSLLLYLSMRYRSKTIKEHSSNKKSVQILVILVIRVLLN